MQIEVIKQNIFDSLAPVRIALTAPTELSREQLKTADMIAILNALRKIG